MSTENFYTDDLKKRIDSILIEYALSPDNEYCGSGLAGNMLYFGYACGRESIINSDVRDVEFKDNKIIWNPEFLALTKKEIRTRLDELVNEKIKEENFEFFLSNDLKENESLISESVKNINSENILFGKELPDLTLLDVGNKLCACMLVCAKFSEHLDKDPNCKDYYENFLNIISKFDSKIALLAIRLKIGLARIIHNHIDEVPKLGSYFVKISSIF